MQLIRCEDLSLRYDQWPLLSHVEFSAEAKERICLIGRNGEGKSSFLKVLAKVQEHDSGILWIKEGYELAYVGQDLPTDIQESVFHYVCGGLAEVGEVLEQYHDLTHELAHNYSDEILAKLESVQQKLEALDGWSLHQRVDTVLQNLGLDPDVSVDSLSGGWRRRVSMARALVCEPDILLLDEPTNHLDIEGIDFLENFLLSYNGTLIFITHDRAFLKRIATSIVELDRGILTRWPGDYDKYLEGKARNLEIQERENAEFDKKLAKEEVWIRQGVKARRTRNEGRVRALKELREVSKLRREKAKDPKFSANTTGISGKLVIQATDVAFSYTNEAPYLIEELNIDIMRGDKMALIGPNGVGKTTLIKLLLGEILPSKGQIRQGTQLEIAYFDQTRAQLNPEESVFDNVAMGKDSLEINGKTQHVFSYLAEFLFSPDKIRTKAKYLSGGEANRLMLAKLFSKPSNVLVLDEPTNDLDIESLELLENILVEYPGTVLLISHDRDFIENVSSHCIVFHKDKPIEVILGGYQDYIRQIQNQRLQKETIGSSNKGQNKEVSSVTEPVVKANNTQKLSYQEKRALEEIPKEVEKLEAHISSLNEQVLEPNFYNLDPNHIKSTLTQLDDAQKALEQLYQRWDDLESKQ